MRRFQQIDVFTSRPFLGNPVAVVLEGEGLSSDDMQRIADEVTCIIQPCEAIGVGDINHQRVVFPSSP